MLSFVQNDPVNDFDPLGLNPFLKAVGKCSVKALLSSRLGKVIDNWVTLSSSCNEIRKRIMAEDEDEKCQWCGGKTITPQSQPELNEETIKGIVAKCLIEEASGSKIDDLLKKYPELKKVVEEVVGNDIEAVVSLLGEINRSLQLNAKCTSQNTITITPVISLTTKFNGVTIDLGTESLPSKNCSGDYSQEVCPPCFRK